MSGRTGEREGDIERDSKRTASAAFSIMTERELQLKMHMKINKKEKGERERERGRLPDRFRNEYVIHSVRRVAL